ncbi:hypothetical protein ACFSR6_17810 [Pedobacter vanadiisoli]|uniref:Lipoprotein n=1 Tax=Pedobacter vanadiisoli TaxID=1761975 RepID=A0ABW5MMN8_9SPHI
MKKLILINFLIVMLYSCGITTKDETYISSAKSSSGKIVKLYYVEVGATANDVIQVRKINKDNDEELLNSYEHNFVKEFKFISADSLFLVLADTTSFGLSKKLDTIILSIK